MSLTTANITFISQVVFLGLATLLSFIGIFLQPQSQNYFISVIATCIGIMIPGPAFENLGQVQQNQVPGHSMTSTVSTTSSLTGLSANPIIANSSVTTA